jgi:hypothetical protein
MAWWGWLLIGIGVLAVVYAAFVVALVLLGRRGDARGMATFIPDCIVLVSRLARDHRVPRWRKCGATQLCSSNTGQGRDRRSRFCCDSSAPRIGSLPRDGHLRVGQRILIVKLFSMTVAESPVTRIVIR